MLVLLGERQDEEEKDRELGGIVFRRFVSIARSALEQI